MSWLRLGNSVDSPEKFPAIVWCQFVRFLGCFKWRSSNHPKKIGEKATSGDQEFLSTVKISIIAMVGSVCFSPKIFDPKITVPTSRNHNFITKTCHNKLLGYLCPTLVGFLFQLSTCTSSPKAKKAKNDNFRDSWLHFRGIYVSSPNFVLQSFFPFHRGAPPLHDVATAPQSSMLR